MTTNFALIPARGGSKRVPEKNLRKFLGEPLINWTIKAALKAKRVDFIVVSSDSQEVLDIAKKAGIDNLHLRSTESSSDSASMQSVIGEIVDFYSTYISKGVNYITLLQPTSPLRSSDDIDSAFELIETNKSANSLVSFTRRPPNLGEEKLMLMSPNRILMMPKKAISEFVPLFVPVLRNGPAICISRLPGAETNLVQEPIIGYEMPWIRSVDIDSEDDFFLAESIGLRILNQNF